MSAADRLLPAYLRALTELLEPEVELLLAGMADGRIHPMGVKTLLAADVTATIHGAQAAADARAAFRARFSQRRYSDAADVPTVSLAVHGDASPAAAFATLAGTVASRKQVRRVAADGGLRLVVEPAGARQVTILLSPADADRALGALLAEQRGDITAGARVFLRCGRRLLELVP